MEYNVFPSPPRIQLANMNIFLDTIRVGTSSELIEVGGDYVDCQNREMDEIKSQIDEMVENLQTCLNLKLDNIR